MQCWTIFHFCPSPSVWLELDSPSDASLQSSGIFSCSVSVQCLWSVCWLLWRWGVSLSLPPLRVVSSPRSCALGVGLAGGGWPLLNYGWRWRGDEGWPRGDIPPSIPNTSDSPPHPSPILSSPSCSPLCPNSHHPRVAWGWMRVTGDVSLSLSVFLLCCFSFSRYTLVLISLFLSFPDFCWESQNERGPFSRNWSADVEKTRQRHTVSWFSSSANPAGFGWKHFSWLLFDYCFISKPGRCTVRRFG